MKSGILRVISLYRNSDTEPKHYLDRKFVLHSQSFALFHFESRAYLLQRRIHSLPYYFDLVIFDFQEGIS